MQTNEPAAVRAVEFAVAAESNALETVENAAVRVAKTGETETFGVDAASRLGKRRRFIFLIVFLFALLAVLGAQAARRAASVKTVGEEGVFAYETAGFNATIMELLDKNATKAVVPEKIGGRRVTKIAAAAFAGCDSLTEVKLPQGVREIGSKAFAGCAALKTITLPERLETLRSAFDGCSTLAEIAVAPGNKRFRSVDGVLFTADGKTLLLYPTAKAAEKYAVPDGTETIASSAFRDSSTLTAITFPASVRELGGEAFFGCVALRSVALPDGVETIPASAFLGCSALSEIRLPKQLKAIAPHSFIGCVNLSRVDFPDGLKTIGDDAFEGCVSLTEMTAPKGLLFIEPGAFGGCVNLSRVVLPDGLRTLGDEAFAGCESLTSVEIPASVETLDRGVFAGRSPELVIRGAAGTCAEAFAAENGIAFEATDAEQTPRLKETSL